MRRAVRSRGLRARSRSGVSPPSSRPRRPWGAGVPTPAALFETAHGLRPVRLGSARRGFGSLACPFRLPGDRRRPPAAPHQGLVAEWATLHENELLENWERARSRAEAAS